MRRKNYRSVVFLAFVLSFSGSVGAVNQADADELPNILILYADDLGFGDLGSFNGKSKIPTPCLDQLAKQGMRFTDGHSSSGICSPSRYALLTGRHHWRDFHGIVNAFGDSVFKPNQLTLPKMLKTQGYRTAVIGKWHLGWDWDAIKKHDAKPERSGNNKQKRVIWGPEDFDWSKPIPGGPLDQGFDHYFGDNVINFPPYCWIEDDKVTQVPDRMISQDVARPKEGTISYRPGPAVKDWDPYENIPLTTQHGVEFIMAQAKIDAPFFLYFAFPSPHAPIIPNDEFDGKSKAGPYGDFVFETDDACGRLLEALDESGQAENTIVVFTADNGPEKFAYAREEQTGHWSSHPFRGLKRDIYEGGHHVPWIVRWPGKVEADSTCEALVSQVDLLATFAAITDYELSKDGAEDSYNLLPLLNQTAKSVRQTHIHNTRKGQYAIRDGDWLLVDSKNGYMTARNKAWEKRHAYPADNESSVELYHLKKDIEQKNDVAEDYPEKVVALQNRLKQIREQGHSAPRFK